MRTGKWLAMVVAMLLGQGILCANPDYNFARISYVEGGFYLQRAENANTGEVGVNTPVGSGDSLWTENGARLELEFEAGNFLRLDQNSRIEIRSISGTSTVGLQGGSVYLDLQMPRQFRVDTPIASMDFLEGGIYRIDMDRGGTVFLTVYQGSAEARNDAGSIVVRSGQQTQIAAGRVPSYPGPFDMGRRDSFDDFQNARIGSMDNSNDQQDYLPAQVAGYGSELNSNGRWSYVSPYGYVWAPDGVATDWRPYRDGYWDYVPGCGWTWISYEPWGWAPYHYGRWDFTLGIGWFWIPGSVWGPAWVSWSNWGDYLGWCPLNWYDRPVVCANNYYGNWWGDNWVSNPDYRSWTFIPKERIGGRDIARVALGENQVRAINRITINKEPINITPKVITTRTPIKGGDIIRDYSGGGSNTIRKIDGSGLSTGGSNTIRRIDGPGGTNNIVPRIEPANGPTIRRDGGQEQNIIHVGPKPESPAIKRDQGGDNRAIYVTPKGTPGAKPGSNTINRDGNQDQNANRPGTKNNVYQPRDYSSNNSSGNHVYYIPATPRSGNTNRVPDDTGSNGFRSYDDSGRSPWSNTNPLTIYRSPEERSYDNAPYSVGRDKITPGNDKSLWGKVYDQYQSRNSTGSYSRPSGNSYTPRSGPSSSGGSGGFSQSSGSRTASPAPSHQAPSPSAPTHDSGNKVEKH